MVSGYPVCDATKHTLCCVSSATGTNPIQEIDFGISCAVKSIK